MSNRNAEGMEWGFDFTPEYCIQCHACEVVCKTWRKTAPWVKRRRVFGVTIGVYPDTKMQTFSLGCMHCVQPACVDACPMGALSKSENGVVAFDAELCVGCGLCAEACPYQVPQISDGLMVKCDMCVEQFPPGGGTPPCACVCPTGALSRRLMTRSEKEAQEKRMRQALTDKENEYQGQGTVPEQG